MADTKFKFFVTQYEGKYFIEDKTEYPCEINSVTYERAEIAIAIVYSTDNGVTYNSILTNDYTNEIQSGSADVIESMVQIIKLYENRAYEVNELTFNDGFFYRSKVDDNNHVPNPENEYWELLTESNATSFLIQNSGLGFYLKKIDAYHDVPASTTFEVDKLTETMWQFYNNNPHAFSVHTLRLFDWEDKDLGVVSDNFEILEDGAYKLQVSYTEIDNSVGQDGTMDDPQMLGADPGDGEILEMLETYIPIIRLSDIQCAYKKMVQSLYCKGSTFCVENDCFAERERIFKINEMSNIYFTLMASLNVGRLDFYNAIGSEESVQGFVQEVGRLVKMVRLMVDECKEGCNDD